MPYSPFLNAISLDRTPGPGESGDVQPTTTIAAARDERIARVGMCAPGRGIVAKQHNPTTGPVAPTE